MNALNLSYIFTIMGTIVVCFSFGVTHMKKVEAEYNTKLTQQYISCKK